MIYLQTHNKYFEQYLDLLINQENKKQFPKTDNLCKMKADHQAKVEQLRKAIDGSDSFWFKVGIEDVPMHRDELLALKHSGPTFRQMLETTKMIQAKKAMEQGDQKVLDVDAKNGRFYDLIKKIKFW